MTTVNVIDAPCGYGKTSWAIQFMNEMDIMSHKFIYVTPLLDEVDRVKNMVYSRKFYEPSSNKGITKLDDLHRLLGEGKDIATTHALFQLANAETRELIRSNCYTLVLDEVMNVIEQVPLRKNDLDILFDAGVIDTTTNDRGLKYVTWLEDKTNYDTEYNNIMHLAQTGNLMLCDNSALIWNLPCDIFTMFKDVFILTYLFKAQFQRYYYDLHEIKYRYLSVVKTQGKYDLVPYVDRCTHDKTKIAPLINIYLGSLNKIGDNRNALSSSWFGKNPDLIVTLRNNTYNFLTNKCKATTASTMWTTVKGNKVNKTKNNTKDDYSIMNKVRPRGFKDSFVPMTARATNEFDEKYHLAYLINRFMSPIEKKFFEQYGVLVDQDAWALSELVQWLWRSKIRKTIPEPVNLYIPSSRMRGLLEKYLNSDFFETPPENAIIDEPPSDWHV